jgi:hypothetical protein
MEARRSCLQDHDGIYGSKMWNEHARHGELVGDKAWNE